MSVLPARRRALLSTGLAAFFGFYLFTGFSGGEAFPFSTFPMYSVARLDPYVVPTQQVFAYSEEGKEFVVTDQGIRGRVRALRREIVLGEVNDHTIGAFADELVRRINAGEMTPERVVGVRVVERSVELAPMGQRDALELRTVATTLLIDGAPANADFSRDAIPSDREDDRT